MKILAIGAFERDNFGDLLFLEVFRKLIGNKATVIPGSIKFSDMRTITGEIIYPYHFLLNNFKFDCVYVVGGEIGGVNSKGGLMMDLPKDTLNDLQCVDDNKLSDYIVKGVTGIEGYNTKHAYIPDIAQYPKNEKTKLILNSVGLSGINNIEEDFLHSTITLLKRATISVREAKSLDTLKKYGIQAEISPDIVHTLPNFHPKFISNKDYFVFQINSELIEKNNYSTKFISNIISEIAKKIKLDVKLFLAGTATFHDDVETYKDIETEFKKINKSQNITIAEERNPLKLVDYISGSKLWIGTSLHGRIVANSYNIPRISIENEKVNNYTSKWDNQFPSNIKLEDVIDKINQVMSPRDIKNNENTKKATENFNKLFNFLSNNNLEENIQEIALNETLYQLVVFKDEFLVDKLIDIKQDVIKEYIKNKKLNEQIEQIRAENIEYNRENQEFKKSKFYKLYKRYWQFRKNINKH